MSPVSGTFHRVIIARELGESSDIRNPFVDLTQFPSAAIFFAAGPLQGAPDWHPELFDELARHVPRFVLVLPTRYEKSHELYQYRLTGVPNYFPRQRRYESFYIKKAREAVRVHPAGGALLFNLCCQVQERTDGRPYATDSWREAAETYTRLSYEPDLGVVVAAESGFPGRELLKDCFDEATGRNFPMYESIPELARAAASFAR